MMSGEVEIDVADGVVGADQRDLFLLGQIAKIEKAKLAEGDQDADRARVFSGVCLGLGLIRTGAIGRRLDAGHPLDVLSVRGEDDGTDTGDSDCISGMNDASPLALDNLQVGGIVVSCDVGVFSVLAVIFKLTESHALGQFCYAPDMIDVKV